MRRALILTSYILVVLAVVGATVLAVAIGQGYSFDRKTNRFILNKGLLIINSSPQSGDIFIDGKNIRRRTPYRSTYVQGDYEIEVRRNGFQTWHKKVSIHPSDVTAVTYALLLPNEIKSEPVATIDTTTQVVASRDRRQFAYLTGAPSPAVWLLSTDRRQSTKLYTAKLANEEQPAETIDSMVWSEDASHLLIRTTIASISQYLVIPASGGSPINLTDLFKFDLAGLVFSPNDWRDLYWISPEGLRRLNVEARTVSAVLADKVSTFTFAGDRLVFVQSTPLGKSVWVSDRNGRDPRRIIESLAEADNYDLRYTNYRGKEWLAVLAVKARTATIYGDIFSPTPRAQVISKSVDHIHFSDDGRYLAVWSADAYGTYDTDKQKIYWSDLEPGSLTALSWFDGAHVILNLKGQIRLAEFDGANSTLIISALPSTQVFGTNDQRHVVSLKPASEADPLQRIYLSEIKH